MITTKTFTSADLAALETELNAFLTPLDAKDILDVIYAFSSTGKYGMSTTYTAMVVYKA